MSLKGLNIAVTGANQGFGLAVAEACVKAGAHLLIGARNPGLLTKAGEHLAGLAGPSQKVISQVLNVADEKSVETFVAAAKNGLRGMDVLINNAGVYGPKGAIEDVNWKEWSDAISINLLGTVMMCRLALPLIKKSRAGKIINLSGGGATAPLPRLSAYAASKAGVVRFTETLAEELRDSNIDVNAVAPGALNTRLLDEVIEAGPAKVGDAFYKKAQKQKAEGGTPLEKGAALCVFLAGAESAGITGKLISAVWDPWTDFRKLKEQFKNNDIYTLRRIVPKDRGLDF